MHNPQLQLAHDFVHYTDKTIFLTGKAGTGKTTFLSQLRNTALKRMAVVAPTGVAAINAGGVTIHSFFQLPFGPYLAQRVAGNAAAATGNQRNHKFSNEKLNLIRSLDLLVIDEISMVRADLLDGIDEILRRYRNASKPFGGIQLLMIGDLHQLSPVVKQNDWDLLKAYYPNLYFFSSHALQQTAHISIELKHIYRQSDAAFIDILNAIRENTAGDDVLAQLNKRYLPGFNPAGDEGYITLTTHNHTAEQINEEKLSALQGKSRLFKAQIERDFPEYAYPTVVDLELKVGAQVMFVKNDKDKLYYNGKIGKVTGFGSTSIIVKCPGDAFELTIQTVQWQNFKYELNTSTKEIEEKVIGTFTQYPLKLAWAITIHKSQGLTFEKAIIDAGASFAHGQVYVALSRCKTLEGMVLRSAIGRGSVKTDGTVAGYTRTAHENAPGEEYLQRSKVAFQQAQLVELFDFDVFKARLYHCKKVAEEYDRTLHPSFSEAINQIRLAAENHIYAVAENFKKQLNALFLAAEDLPEKDAAIQERIKKACAYFTGKLEAEMYNQAKQADTESDNKTAKKAAQESLELLRKEIVIKVSALKACAGGFETTAYLRAKANAEIDYSLAANKSPAQPVAARSTKHPGLYLALKAWRDEQAAEGGVPVYHILPQKTIAALLEELPSTTKELAAINGFGSVKIRRYGEEIVTMINAYCNENSIERDAVGTSSAKPKIRIDTKRTSLELFRQGKTIAEIAAQRGFTTGTIEGHIFHYIAIGEIDIHELIPEEKIERVQKHVLPRHTSLQLTDLKTALGDDFSYNELRAIIAYLKLTNKLPGISGGF